MAVPAPSPLAQLPRQRGAARLVDECRAPNGREVHEDMRMHGVSPISEKGFTGACLISGAGQRETWCGETDISTLRG